MRSERGFTLVEMLIAVAIVMLAILLACDLLTESGKLLQHSVRRARDPTTLLGTEMLRNDLRAAEVVANPDHPLADLAQWQYPPENSLLVKSRLGDVVWAPVEGALQRGDLQGTRPRLPGLVTWRWRVRPGGILEVEAEVATSRTYVQQLAGSLPKPDPGDVERLHLLVALRVGGSQW